MCATLKMPEPGDCNFKGGPFSTFLLLPCFSSRRHPSHLPCAHLVRLYTLCLFYTSTENHARTKYTSLHDFTRSVTYISFDIAAELDPKDFRDNLPGKSWCSSN